MLLQVLGAGCPKCTELLANVESAVRELGLACRIEKVTDIQRIVQLGVMSTPALVVDGQVKLAGKASSVEAIKALLT